MSYPNTIYIDESTLYGDDHHERCLAYIERFFQNSRPAGVYAVYVVGSVATGDYMPGYSDLDIMIVTNGAKQIELMETLRQMNEKLRIPSFHLHRAIDFPPPNLYINLRMHSEARLLYGQDLLEPLSEVSAERLKEQLFASLSHQVVMLRSLCCSRDVEEYTPDYTVYYAQKMCLFGVRAWLSVLGDWNTQRRHVIERVTSAEALLSPQNRTFFQVLLKQWAQKEYPETLAERLRILHQTTHLLEEIQDRILGNGQ